MRIIMYKKLISILLSFTMIFVLVGCSLGGNIGNKTTNE